MFTTHAVDNPFPKTAARPSCITQFRINHHLLGKNPDESLITVKLFYHTCGNAFNKEDHQQQHRMLMRRENMKRSYFAI
jgi:hypothetical protein